MYYSQDDYHKEDYYCVCGLSEFCSDYVEPDDSCDCFEPELGLVETMTEKAERRGQKR